MERRRRGSGVYHTVRRRHGSWSRKKTSRGAGLPAAEEPARSPGDLLVPVVDCGDFAGLRLFDFLLLLGLRLPRRRADEFDAESLAANLGEPRWAAGLVGVVSLPSLVRLCRAGRRLAEEERAGPQCLPVPLVVRRARMTFCNRRSISSVPLLIAPHTSKSEIKTLNPLSTPNLLIKQSQKAKTHVKVKRKRGRES